MKIFLLIVLNLIPLTTNSFASAEKEISEQYASNLTSTSYQVAEAAGNCFRILDGYVFDSALRCREYATAYPRWFAEEAPRDKGRYRCYGCVGSNGWAH